MSSMEEVLCPDFLCSISRTRIFLDFVRLEKRSLTSLKFISRV